MRYTREMKQFSLYALLSVALFFVSLLLLDVSAFREVYEIIQYIVVPLWEHPYSGFSLLLTDLGSLSSAIIFFLILTTALILEGHWKRALVVAGIGILTALFTFLAKEIIALPRPIEQLRIVSGSRFPSGHAAAAMAMTLSLIYVIYEYTRSLWLRIPVVLIALSFAGMIGATRVFMNVHRPLDIIAGFAIALFSFSIILILARRLHGSA